MIDEDTALQWRDEVWTVPEKEELDEDGEPKVTYSSKGVPIRFVTVVLKKSEIESSYPGGLSGILERFPDALRDERLIGLVSTSAGEAEGLVSELRSAGLDMDKGAALADPVAGPLWTATGIAFQCRRPSRKRDRGWIALAVDHRPGSAAGERAMLLSFEEAMDALCGRACANFPPPTSYTSSIGSLARRQKVRQFVESYVVSHGRLPAGKHDIPGIGKTTF